MNDLKKIRGFLGISGGLVFILLFYYDNYESHRKNDKFCKMYNDFVKQSFHGVVTKSIYDKENHDYPTLVLRIENGIEKEYNLVYALNAQLIIANINIGDSIFKIVGSDIIYVNNYKELKVDFDCKK